MAPAPDAQGMMVPIANPSWLWGLLALALPIALHLYGRQPGRTVKLGTLRDIPATRVARAFALRVEDRWRLLLRCSVFAVVVLALAAPLIRARRTAGDVVIASAATLASASGQQLADSLRTAGAADLTLGEGEDVWSGALRAAERSRGRLHIVGVGITGELGSVRPSLQNEVQWHRVDVASAMAMPPGAPRTLVLADPLTGAMRRRLDAAIAAVAAEAGLKRSDLIVVTDTTLGDEGADRLTLSAADIASADLPFRLAAAWLAPERARELSQLPVPMSMAMPARSTTSGTPRPPSDTASKWLLGMAALLLLAERALSQRPPKVVVT